MWWVVLMSLWVWIDDSLDAAELVVGAVVAVLGALLAELAQYQSGSHIRIRLEWLRGRGSSLTRSFVTPGSSLPPFGGPSAQANKRRAVSAMSRSGWVTTARKAIPGRRC